MLLLLSKPIHTAVLRQTCSNLIKKKTINQKWDGELNLEKLVGQRETSEAAVKEHNARALPQNLMDATKEVICRITELTLKLNTGS